MSVAQTILNAFKKLKYTQVNHLDKELIKHHVKSQLTAEEIKSFNFTAKKYAAGNYIVSEENKIITKIELSKKGYDQIYSYDPYQTEVLIIDKIVSEFSIINKSRKEKTPDKIALYSLINSVSFILNPKQIEDGCIQQALNALILEDLIIVKDGIVRLTSKAFNLLYPDK